MGVMAGWAQFSNCLVFLVDAAAPGAAFISLTLGSA